MNRFIITTTEIEKKEYRIAALCDARQKLIEVTTESMTGTSVLGNIYIGRVENVVKNLNAAFVCIAPGQNCYLPLQELKNPVFTKKQSEKKAICAGDELLVQVVKEALKTKDPSRKYEPYVYRKICDPYDWKTKNRCIFQAAKREKRKTVKDRRRFSFRQRTDSIWCDRPYQCCAGIKRGTAFGIGTA